MKKELTRNFRVGVDVGGTFTDFFIYDDESNKVSVTKTTSTPQNPAQGILDGLKKSGIDPQKIKFIVHGSTVGTNALITRNLPRAAFITTKNFKDVIEIGRGIREDLWDAYKDRAKPYIPRRDRFEVEERIDYDGNLITPLNVKEARDVCRVLKRRGIESIAVCFLNSYMNPENEIEMKKILEEELPGIYYCISSEIMPEIFEHERGSTTMINTCLGPVVSEYLYTLVKNLEKLGFKGDVLVAHSGGGVMTAKSIAYYASRIANSGPSAGAVAGSYIAKDLCGFKNSIHLDMGGTSADVSLMSNGNMRITNDWWIEFGYPILFPTIEIISIGAGGGSIAWLDDGGSLRVGPQSQGAVPGPVCYMKGGDIPTVTDASLVLNRLDPDWLLGGELRLNKEAAEKAIKSQIADKLGITVVEAADAIIRIANAHMCDAVKLLSTRRGYDLRDFSLVIFGGAGPLHGVSIAEELSIPNVIVPPWPGITSAMGCLWIDIRHDTSTTFIANMATVDLKIMEKSFREMEAEVIDRLKAEDIPKDKMRLFRYLDLRYLGQWRYLSLTVSNPLPPSLAVIRTQFDKEHQREYSYSDEAQAVQIYGIRVTGYGLIEKPKLQLRKHERYIPKPTTTRKVYNSEAKKFLNAKIYEHDQLLPGALLTGPAVIHQFDSTVFIPTSHKAEVDPYKNIIIRLQGGPIDETDEKDRNSQNY
jgi:N-methylhydantoinase A